MKCKICGGDTGGLSPDGAHYLCQERAKRGLPTPCLGMRCAACGGTGVKAGSRGGVMLSFDLGPAAIRRSIEAQFPACGACGGSGRVG